MPRAPWVPDRRDMIWIDCSPQTGREMKDVHPLLVLYILGHQPKSFDWRASSAKPHPWKQIPSGIFSLACETLNQIVDLA
jgi:mRNA interferase MazF